MPPSAWSGVVEDILADRAFVEERHTQRGRALHASPTSPRRRRTSSPTRWPPRRSPGPTACRRRRSATGCAPFRPDGHRIATVAEVDGVTWVDDSKATNPHAAQSSLSAYDPVVWVAGGLAKGARFDELVRAVRARLRGVVLLGRDRHVIAEALSRHAPDVPVDRRRPAARLTPSTTPWRASWRPRPTWPDPATRCCWRRDARPWTCSPTTRARGDAFAAAVTTQGRDRAETGAAGPADGGSATAVTTTADPGPSVPPPTPRAPVRALGWFAASRQALDRPLTSYYLLLGASALLLTIGLIMVLSASSVYSFEVHDGDSYAIVKRQLMWVAIGIPCAWIASRLPYQAIRQISWVAIVVSVVLLALTAKFGVVVNGNKNWLAVGPIQIQPSEIAKLAIVLWAAHVYAQKDRRLGSLHQVMVPVVPVLLGIILLVIIGKRPRHRPGALRDPAGHALGGGGARPAVHARAVGGRRGRGLAGDDQLRATRAAHQLRRPVQGLPRRRAGSPPTASSPSPRGGCVRRGHRRQPAEVGRPARGPHRLHLRGARRGARAGRHAAGHRACSSIIAYAAIRVATQTDDPFVRYMSFGIVAWLIGQMIVNVGMVLALLPVIGIPLPLISYGGSALLPTLVALGLLIGFARREPEAARRSRSAAGSGPPGSRPRAGSGRTSAARPRLAPDMRVLLAGGGTAGHTSPLIATADALRRLDPGVEVTCLGTPRGLENRVVPEAGYPLELIPPVPLPRRPGVDLLQGARPAARRRTGDARRARPGAARRGRRLRRLRLDAGSTSPPAAASCRSSSTSRTRCRASPTRPAPGSPAGWPSASRTRRCRARSTSGCRSAG